MSNGSNSSNNTFEFCGEPKATFTINTIAKNIANTVNGSILKFTGDATPNGTPNPSTILSANSSLTLKIILLLKIMLIPRSYMTH